MILEVKELYKQFKRHGVDFYAVENINLQAAAGDYIGITGQSGSGKSTLFHLLSGLLRTDKGQILLDNHDILKDSRKNVTELRNGRIGYIMQGQYLLPNFNVIENVCMPYYLSGRKGDASARALELLSYVGLADRKEEFPNRLSGGEIRRAAIARALITSPDILLADEPASNLDADNSAKVMKLLKEISLKGTLVLASSHDMEHMKDFNRAYRMTQGRLESL